ncbi:hypothetical protein ACQQ2N_19740 [Dokdonella sp. MW10]|uniref:hypothetical protein n=1 Tax=Dokdonella sp. MW10 TaxID=2992926 RepID=UPI003F7E170B
MRTSIHSILCIAIRLGAVLMAWATFAQVLALVAGGMLEQGGVSPWLVGGLAAVSFVIAVLLWRFPSPLASFALGRGRHEVFESPIGVAELQWIALSVLGMWFVMTGLSHVAYWGLSHAAASEYVRLTDDMRRARVVEGIGYAFDIVLGLALVFGSKGLVALLHRMRHGRAAATSTSSAPSAD